MTRSLGARLRFSLGTILPLFLVSCGIQEPAPASAALQASVRQRIPAATSMLPEEFIMLTNSTSADVPVKSMALSHALLSLGPNEGDSHLRFASPLNFTPEGLYKHVLKGGLATLIHDENIRKLSVEVTPKDGVMGSVDFQVPGFMEGRFFIRARADGRDQVEIVECVLLGNRQVLQKNDRGHWVRSRLEDAQAASWKQFSDRFPKPGP